MSSGKKKIVVFGSFNIDITARVKRFPQGGESMLCEKSQIGTGGKGANQALAAAKSGGDVHFIAKIGRDQFGKMAEEAIKSSAISQSTLLITESSPTGSALIYISEEKKENMIVVCPGANATVAPQDLAAIASTIASADILLVQGENNHDATAALVREAHRNNKTVILNPAPFSDGLFDMLPCIDIITPNETEAALLSGLAVSDIASAKAAAQRIAERGPATVLITLGEKGALIFHEGVFTPVAPFECRPADTTGAGDAFNGALVAALADGQSIVQAATWAAAFASLAVEREGASSHPEVREVEEKMVRSGRNMLPA